jgi:hypothetical protein
MDFPLIPSRSSHLPFRGKTDLLPQPSPESLPVPQAASNPALLIKGFKSMGNTVFIDVEFQENLPDKISNWPDYQLRNAFSQYHSHSISPKKQKTNHIIDLYV